MSKRKHKERKKKIDYSNVKEIKKRLIITRAKEPGAKLSTRLKAYHYEGKTLPRLPRVKSNKNYPNLKQLNNVLGRLSSGNLRY